MDEESTQQMSQPLTQNKFDPRRTGRNNSGLAEDDISDVICVLHPTSPAAFRIVNHTAQSNPRHILQNNDFDTPYQSPDLGRVTEAETIIVSPKGKEEVRDLALRFSSPVIDPALGFCFGRSPHKCDINLDSENRQKRVSNTHFRIFVNDSGVLMLEDMSTNGTVVDGYTLGGRKRSEQNPKTRMLNFGSIIQILADTQEETIKFITSIPSRDGHRDEYTAKFHAYLQHKSVAEQRAQAAARCPPMPEIFAKGMLAAPLTGPPNAKSIPTFNAPVMNSNYGMHWDGGNEFKCIGVLGKGAFAIVYHVARRVNGELFAAKELEKKRVMKNGVMDHRIDNEMRIMKGLRHENIVQYIDYVEKEQHLYIIMEYVQYGDLSGYMQLHKKLPEHMGKKMTLQMMSALAYLHNKNITHRDIKPDNILIASEDPFVCKLTDFGLSKMVKNNETFLKTFCGTLLYCAPEVFPHYSEYISGNKPKRRRPGSSSSSTRRSYSQLVDIWSYAAVLWYVLCGSPPFEGVVDAAGRGMFQKIMETDLDIEPLQKNNVSVECIDLLEQMLDTDPQTRPSEQDCLNHPWLCDGTIQKVNSSGLPVIPEGEEDLDASQLSIHDRLDEDGSDEDEDDDDDSSFGELLINGPNKRFKGSGVFEDNQFHQRHHYAQVGHIPTIVNGGHQNRAGPVAPRPPKLFGEISQPPWPSSEIPPTETALPVVEKFGEMPADALGSKHKVEFGVDTGVTSNETGRTNSTRKGPATGSLLGTEDIFKGMKMASPEPQTPNNPSTPKASVQIHRSTENHKSDQNREDEVTPRPKQTTFSRQIDLPVPASLFFDPNDPNTHNNEYASRVSGIAFLGETGASSVDINALPPDVVASFRSGKAFARDEREKENVAVLAQLSAEGSLGSNVTSEISSGEFTKPAPLLGRLTTTVDSFASISLSLTRRRTTWGRLPSNTHVYRDAQDTRIPKLAIDLWFHARGAEEAEQSGKDLSKLEGLVAIVRTSSRSGIYINGVRLTEKDETDRLLYGEVHTGDEICVWSQPNGRSTLKFVCEFFYGASAKPRMTGEKFVAKASPAAAATTTTTATTVPPGSE